MDTGTTIRKLRQKKGLTAKQLAVLARLSQISMIENGQRDGRLSSLRKIANALGVPMAALFGAPKK